MYFTSCIQVGESVQKPAKYHANNVTNTLHLLDALLASGVQRFIFFVHRSKLMMEQVLEGDVRAFGLNSGT